MQKLFLGSKKLGYVRHLLCVFLLLFCKFSTSELFSLEMLSNISDEDTKNLEELFDYFVKRTTFSYTLFGDKPVSWLVISLPQLPKIKPPKKIIHTFSGSIPLWSKWQIWKKHEKKIPFTNYLFIEEANSSHLLRKDIFFINKKHFIKTVDQHKEIFQKILNQRISGQSLLNEIENKSSLKDVIVANDLLLGILLGFGSDNSNLYQQRKELSLSYKQYSSILIKEAHILKKLEKKIKKNSNILQPLVNCDYSPLLIGTIQFGANLKCFQTRNFQQKYNFLRGRICEIYSKGNLLNITLCALIQE